MSPTSFQYSASPSRSGSARAGGAGPCGAWPPARGWTVAVALTRTSETRAARMAGGTRVDSIWPPMELRGSIKIAHRPMAAGLGYHAPVTPDGPGHRSPPAAAGLSISSGQEPHMTGRIRTMVALAGTLAVVPLAGTFQAGAAPQ